MTIEQIQSLIRKVPDFPKPGVLFQDITPILADAEAFKSLALKMSEMVDPTATKIVAIESRGFILGSAIAQHLKCGMVLVRKPGKLPRRTFQEPYDLEYGQDVLELHQEDLISHDRVVIVDDILATGGTAAAVERLIAKTGAKVLGSVFVMDIPFLEGVKKLSHPAKVLFS